MMDGIVAGGGGWRTWWLVRMALALWLGGLGAAADAQALTQADLLAIARRIWQNESAGRVEGLTAWNAGENFASLGVGHFIWYPAGETGPFEESFPPLLGHLRRHGVVLPGWLERARGCPWPNRAAFMKDKDSARMVELRNLLRDTQALQVLYIIERLERTLPRYRAAAGRDSGRVLANVQALRQTRAGTFALIDYINFKGDGLNPGERYKGQGWGLMQVLQEMEPGRPEDGPRAFADAAKKVMSRRVENSPPQRGERRWLQGWLNRCEAYARPF